jgi:hypothetical protein
VPDYVPADQVAALPDLVRPEVTDRMAILVVQCTTPGAGLTMRTQELVREYGLTRSAGATWSGTWQIISTVNARITARDWFVTRSGSPQHLNEVHQLRPLDDPLGVIPPDQAWLTANHAAFERFPRARAPSCSGVRFTRADATAMGYAVNVDGLDPLSAARRFMGKAQTAIANAGRHAAAYLDSEYTRSAAERERIFGLLLQERDQILSLGPKYRQMVRDEPALMELLERAAAKHDEAVDRGEAEPFTRKGLTS